MCILEVIMYFRNANLLGVLISQSLNVKCIKSHIEILTKHSCTTVFVISRGLFLVVFAIKSANIYNKQELAIAFKIT